MTPAGMFSFRYGKSALLRIGASMAKGTARNAHVTAELIRTAARMYAGSGMLVHPLIHEKAGKEVEREQNHGGDEHSITKDQIAG